MKEQAMFKNQPMTIKLSYNGPFVNHQTAPLSFNQTVRNIALARSAAQQNEAESHEQFNLRTTKAEDPPDKM